MYTHHTLCTCIIYIYIHVHCTIIGAQAELYTTGTIFLYNKIYFPYPMLCVQTVMFYVTFNVASSLIHASGSSPPMLAFIYIVHLYNYM